MVSKKTLEKIADKRINWQGLLSNPNCVNIARYLENEGKANANQIAEALELPENETGVYLGELGHEKLIGGRFKRQGRAQIMYFHLRRKGKKYLETFQDY